MHVAVHYNGSAGPAGETVVEIRALGVGPSPFQADLSRLPDIRDLVDGIDDRWGRLDVLVNSAAIFPRTPGLRSTRRRGTARSTSISRPRSSPPGMPPRSCSGTAAERSSTSPTGQDSDHKNYLPYVISKGGIITMTKAMAQELAPSIAVNAIAPGPVMLPEDFDAAVAERIRKGYAARKAQESTTTSRRASCTWSR